MQNKNLLFICKYFKIELLYINCLYRSELVQLQNSEKQENLEWRVRMVYRDFQGMRLSALGMGAMRLPVVNGNDAEIDSSATEEMVAYAMEQGVNYYDTAWGYHNGNSELVMGKALAKYPRDSFYLATKFPGYDLSNMPKVEEIFEKQLEKCGVDYFDACVILGTS